MGKSSGSDKTTVVSRHDAVPFGTLVGDFSSVTVSDGKGNTAKGSTKEQADKNLQNQTKK